MASAIKKPTQQDAHWALDYLPLLYDLAWAFERKHMQCAYKYMTAVCYEIDRIVAHQDYLPCQAKHEATREA